MRAPRRGRPRRERGAGALRYPALACKDVASCESDAGRGRLRELAYPPMQQHQDHPIVLNTIHVLSGRATLVFLEEPIEEVGRQ